MSDLRRGRRRGNYNCGRCGQPKKGHVCHLNTTAADITTNDSSSVIVSSSPNFPTSPLPPPPRHTNTQLRRALSFDDDFESLTESDNDDDNGYTDFTETVSDSGESGLPSVVLWEIMRKLPPTSLLSAAKVCKGWRDCTKKVWKAAEELRLVVPAKSQIGFVGSVLQKCSKLVRLSLSMESDVDATMLACIAFSCPNLESLEIKMLEKAINRLTGDELGRFVADKRCLSSLKIEGCSHLGYFNFCSSSLSTLWLSNLYSLSKTVINCPNLMELSLDFTQHENDYTDLSTMVDSFARGCPRLQNIHIASVRLSNAVVHALTDANLRGLRMLSLVLGSGITDASVAAIASSFPNLELLDLSGSSISDGGIGMLCNELPDTLSRLLLALCPNITSSGIQFAIAQLPLLEVMDCGMSLCDPNSQNLDEETGSNRNNAACEFNHMQKASNSKLHLIYQKMIIKHLRLKKLSLWGCSGLDALYLNCPELDDLNLTSCTNLHPERLQLNCPSLKSVHASGCQITLVRAIRSQVCNDFDDVVDHCYPFKRLADGSKRIRVPQFLNPQTPDFEKRKRVCIRPPCTVYVR
ncbi:F-box/LRR-repeat protein [Thalictrum thalictroides]|uniref:F-box/LRR-repeat protein n=1 Tax=Thalictrum thalictroides TaxID=46969 RepID=A0A7J6V977_THATH|nr:F-box/LRR-repeat protein [Thalictrum thalictroides]